MNALRSEDSFEAFASNLSPRDAEPNFLIREIMDCAGSIWGKQTRLTLQGSAAKGTNISGSDFDYHIECTKRCVSLEDMHRLRSMLETKLQWAGVQTNPNIVVALKLHYEATETFGVIELVPERADYFPQGAQITKADPYFKCHPYARAPVRVLKYLFKHSRPKIKHCFMEDLVKMADGHHPWNSVAVFDRHCSPIHSLGLRLFKVVIGDLADYPNLRIGSPLERHVHAHDKELTKMGEIARHVLQK